jgi:hypothetical protein
MPSCHYCKEDKRINCWPDDPGFPLGRVGQGWQSVITRKVVYITSVTGNWVIVIWIHVCSEWLRGWATGLRFLAGAVLEFCRVYSWRPNGFLILAKIKSSLRMSRPTWSRRIKTTESWFRESELRRAFIHYTVGWQPVKSPLFTVTCLTFTDCAFCPHIALTCSVWISEQDFHPKYNINSSVVCNQGGGCFLRGTHWAFK